MTIPNVVVSAPSQLFTLPNSFAAIAGGSIYIGQIDTDPTVVANQIQVYVQNDDGSTTAVSQPLNIGAGGYPEYNGAVAKFVTVEGQSMAVLDANGVQQFYYPDVFKYDPDQLRCDLLQPTGASLIGFMDSNISDSIYYRMPEMYGAIGDGITDDTAAMQSAINDCENKTLIILNDKSYRLKNITIPHQMTIRGLGRRQGGALIPYGNNPSEQFIQSGNFIYITTTGTVTFYDVTIDARNIPLTSVDGFRLNGVVGADNTTGIYQSGYQMYNCNVSGFSGFNIVGGGGKSFGIIKDCQSESSSLSCIKIDGVDWRIDHSYFGRSLEAHGILISQQSNQVTYCDSYFNKLSGIAYLTTAIPRITLAGNTLNSNGQNGITISCSYTSSLGGCIVAENTLWNNSTEVTGTYMNIDVNGIQGVMLLGNNHFAEQGKSGSSVARCSYCINLRGGATASLINDFASSTSSYVNGFINTVSENVVNNQETTFGTRKLIEKLLSNDTSIGYSSRLQTEEFPRVQIGAGNVRLGGGISAPDHGITSNAIYPGITMGIAGLGVIGNYATSVLRIGMFRLWSDEVGALRIKVGSDPTSATDGAILFSSLPS